MLTQFDYMPKKKNLTNLACECGAEGYTHLRHHATKFTCSKCLVKERTRYVISPSAIAFMEDANSR